MNKLRRAMRNKKGFTMIELVLVVIVLGLLAAIAYPKLSENKKTGYIGQAAGIYQALNGALHMVYGQKCAGQAAATQPYDMTTLTTLAVFQGIVFDGSGMDGTVFTCVLGGNTFTYTLAGVNVPTAMGVITHNDWSAI